MLHIGRWSLVCAVLALLAACAHVPRRETAATAVPAATHRLSIGPPAAEFVVQGAGTSADPGLHSAESGGDFAAAAQPMVLHFINVGQGAATLVEFPGNCGAILIDGGAGPRFEEALIRYLDWFFDEERPDLQRTLKALYITHPHEDHMGGLVALGLGGDPFEPTVDVLNLIDDGFSREPPKEWEVLQSELGTWVRSELGADHHESVMFEQHPPVGGVTSAVIDPINCSLTNPRIRALWGGSKEATFGDAKNPNNHSLVIRIDYGDSSVLITGDLETPAIKKMLAWYGNDPSVLDIDLYVPGHHGAENGTTVPMLKAMSPDLAVLQVGDMNEGVGGQTAFGFGHPRLSTVNGLESVVRCGRERAYGLATSTASPSDSEMLNVDTPCHIYATGWNGYVRVTMPFRGKSYRVAIECSLSSADAGEPGKLEALHECVGPK